MARPKGRHSRSVFLWTTCFLAIAFAATEYGLPPLLEPVRDLDYFVRMNRVRQRRDVCRVKGADRPPLLVMLGTSRTQCGFDGQTAELVARRLLGQEVQVANFGANGGNAVYQLLVLRRLLRDGIEPNMVLVEVMPRQMHRDSLDDLFSTRDNMLLESDRSFLIGHERLRSLRALRRLGSPAVWAYRKELLQNWLPNWFESQAEGRSITHDAWGTFHPKEPQNLEVGRDRRMETTARLYRESLCEFQLGQAALIALREILVECRDRGIPSALVLMPEGPVIRSWYRPGARSEIRDAVAQLADEMECPWIDACEWLDDESYFRDSHHLTKAGSLHFTERLMRTAVSSLAGDTMTVAAPSQVTPLRR